MSDRKLKGLLTPQAIPNRDHINSNRSIRMTSSPTPSPTVIAGSHKSTPSAHPQIVPAYYEIPGVQDFFYYPIPKNEPPVQPSPWLEPFKLHSLKDLPPLSHASAHTAADSKGDPSPNQAPYNDCSASLCSLAVKLNIQPHSQPKNLEELLQRSFCSMPSYSAMASPRNAGIPSGFPSPFIRSHTSHLYGTMAPGSASDLSFRGNSLIKSPFHGSQGLKSQVSLTNMANSLNTDEGLIFQIASLINRENDGRIRSAISELLAQYGEVEELQKKAGTQFQRYGPAISNEKADLMFSKDGQELMNLVNLGDMGIPKQKTIALSNGLTMNALNRSPQAGSSVINNDNFKANPQNTKIEAARRGLFGIEMSESANPKPQDKPEKQNEGNDFNLFDNMPENRKNARFYSHCSSPLISSATALKDGLNANLFSQPFMLTSHSLSQQAASLSTNSSHSENQRGVYMNKKVPLEMIGKPTVSSSFRLKDELPLQNRILDAHLGIDLKIHQRFIEDQNIKMTPKSGPAKTNKNKPKAANGKKGRAKNKKVTVDEYMKHVHAQSVNDSNLTIEETGGESDDWDDVEVKEVKVK